MKYPQLEIKSNKFHFRNPFSTEPIVEVGQTIEKAAIFLEASRWAKDMPSILVEVLLDELENSMRLFYLSKNNIKHFFVENEPLYYLFLFKLIEKFIQTQTLNYSLSGKSSFKVLNYSKLSDPGVNFERPKSLLLFFCLVQFRNNKASSFNILFLVISEILKNMWGSDNNFNEAVKTLITCLQCNAELSIYLFTINNNRF